MLNCYFCGNDYALNSFPEEHIIPNSLGGRLKSTKLICEKCNQKCGRTVDLEWSKLALGSFVNVKRDRGNNPLIKGVTESGLKIAFDHRLIPHLIEPFIERDQSGQIKRIVAHNKEAVKSLLRKEKENNPDLDIDELEKKISEEEMVFTEPVFPQGYAFGGNKLFGQAVTRVGTNYFMHSGGNKNDIYTTIQYLKDSIKFDEAVAFHFYPEQSVNPYSENEISHLLYLHGSYEQRILYCYVELFSCFCFLIQLSTYYTGPDLENLYCYDLLNNNINKNKIISLAFTRDEFLKVPYLKVNEVIGREKLHRVYDIMGIDYTSKEPADS
jgi:hypothetical protein